MSDTFDHYGDALNECLMEWDGVTYIDDYVRQELGPPLESVLGSMSRTPSSMSSSYADSVVRVERGHGINKRARALKIRATMRRAR